MAFIRRPLRWELEPQSNLIIGPSVMGRNDSSQSLKSRSRGVYYRACDVCRKRKVKCDGKKPCNPCKIFRSEEQCTWSPIPAKKGIAQNVEALNKHIQNLENYVTVLEAQQEQCRDLHGGLSIYGHQMGRPVYLSDSSSSLQPQDDELEEDSSSNPDQGDINEQLIASTMHLKLECQDLYLYGPTSIFRIPSRGPSSRPRTSQSAESSHLHYELWVEGPEPASFDPTFAWSRHLPVDVSLTRKEHDRCLDLLFKFSMSWCLRIVPATFLKDMYEALSGPAAPKPPRTPNYSPMLHNAALALAMALSDDPALRDSRHRFVEKAKDYMDAECAKPAISTVNAFSLLASYYSSMGDQTLGYVYCGISARLSQALGLHIDCSPWFKSERIDYADMLGRNLCYWTTFRVEVSWALYVGRDIHLPLPEGSNAPAPHVDPELDQILWHHPPCGLAPQPSFMSRVFSESCVLFRIARRILDVVNRPGIKADTNDLLISKLDVELNAWHMSLPTELADTLASRQTMLPHRIMLHITYWWLFMLLHSPFYRRTPYFPSSEQQVNHVKICNKAADNIMGLLDTWRSLYTLRCVPIMMVQVIFSTATSHMLSAVQAVSGLRIATLSLRQSLARLEFCFQYLSEIGRAWDSAHRCAAILSNLIREQLMPHLATRSPTQFTIKESGPSSSSSLASTDIAAQVLSPSMHPSQQSETFPSLPESPASPLCEQYLGGELPDWLPMSSLEMGIRSQSFDPSAAFHGPSALAEDSAGMTDFGSPELETWGDSGVPDPNFVLTEEDLECLGLFFKRQAQYGWE